MNTIENPLVLTATAHDQKFTLNKRLVVDNDQTFELVDKQQAIELHNLVIKAIQLLSGMEHALLNTRPQAEWDDYMRRMKEFIIETDYL